MTERTLLRRIVLSRWLRGPAWQEGDAIVMDVEHAEAYQPLADPKICLALASIHTPAEAVAFTRDYGLLESSDASTKHAARVREPFRVFAESADLVRGVIRTVLDVKRATNGDEDALARLKTRVTEADRRLVDADDRAILIRASDAAAWLLSQKLMNARPLVYDRAGRGENIAPGHLHLAIVPETLLQVCFVQVAFRLADREPINVCPGCDRAFVVEDGRQQYCTPACASRTRCRRFQERNEQQAAAKRSKKPKAATKRSRRRKHR